MEALDPWVAPCCCRAARTPHTLSPDGGGAELSPSADNGVLNLLLLLNSPLEGIRFFLLGPIFGRPACPSTGSGGSRSSVPSCDQTGMLTLNIGFACTLLYFASS